MALPRDSGIGLKGGATTESSGRAIPYSPELTAIVAGVNTGSLARGDPG